MLTQHTPRIPHRPTILHSRWANLALFAAGLIAILLLAWVIIAQLATPTAAPVTSVPIDVASVGQHTTVTGMVFDGARYRAMPISIGEFQAIYPSSAPMRHLTGSVYEPGQVVEPAAPISTGAPMRHLTGSVYEP